MGRRERGEKGVYGAFEQTSTAKTVYRQPAPIYRCLDLYETFGVPSWRGWGEYFEGDMEPRKFTQEYLSHGIIKFDDTPFCIVSMDDLVDSGLFGLCPSLQTPSDIRRTG